MANHHLFGTTGEQLAGNYLQQRGFKILFTNWRYSHYEIDIIASKNNVVHFIEVKSRRSVLFGYPEEAVSRKKFNNLKQAAVAFQYLQPQTINIQFDILSILAEKDKPIAYFFIEDVYLY